MFKWINMQIEWLKGFFQESDGKPSNKRLVGTIVVCSFLAAYSKTAIITAEKVTAMPDIPPTWAVLIAAILSLNIVANYLSGKKKENGNGHGPSDTPQQSV